MNYDWNFGRLVPYTHAYLMGTMTTITITVLVVFFGSVMGVTLGLLLGNRLARILLYPLIDIIRALPPLVLILFFYYLLTEQMIGKTIGGYWVATFALSLNLAAFVADLVRAAVENVPKSALDAGRALAMSRRQLTRHIVIPYVLLETMPSMMTLFIGALKLTSLASVINVNEVVYISQTVITDISRSLESWVVVGAIYISLVMPATYFSRFIESLFRQSESLKVRANE